MEAFFDVFCQHANEAAEFQYMHLVYVKMPRTGQSSRCQVWREYGVLKAMAAGDQRLANDARYWSDNAIIAVVSQVGLPI